jgi:hypothetical protein
LQISPINFRNLLSEKPSASLIKKIWMIIGLVFVVDRVKHIVEPIVVIKRKYDRSYIYSSISFFVVALIAITAGAYILMGIFWFGLYLLGLILRLFWPIQEEKHSRLDYSDIFDEEGKTRELATL